MTQGENFDVYDSRKENHSWKVDEHKEKIDATWDGERKGYKIEKVSRELLEKIFLISPELLIILIPSSQVELFEVKDVLLNFNFIKLKQPVKFLASSLFASLF